MGRRDLATKEELILLRQQQLRTEKAVLDLHSYVLSLQKTYREILELLIEYARESLEDVEDEHPQ